MQRSVPVALSSRKAAARRRDTTVGATVAHGEPLVKLEAMKMVNQLRAPRDGVVAEIYVGAGDQVRYGETLIRFEDAVAA